MKNYDRQIESLIFTAENPITLLEIKTCLDLTYSQNFEKEQIEEAIGRLQQNYLNEQFSFELVKISDGFQFLSKAAYHEVIGIHLKQQTKKRLTKAALETLSIIAYKQPVTKTELEQIRGVSCDYSIQKLLEKELISITGRSELPGRPLLYGTSPKFMNYFGINTINDLPKLKDFKLPQNEIGAPAEIEENSNVIETKDATQIDTNISEPADIESSSSEEE